MRYLKLGDKFLMCFFIFRTWRYAAYRQYVWWVHSHLGKRIRRVIPACAVGRIRAEFEECDGNYKGFSGDDPEVGEILAAFQNWNSLDE